MTTPSPGDHENDATQSLDQADIEADIQHTREDLARTVDQLAAKMDVKARVSDRVAAAKDDGVRQLHELQDKATDARGRPTGGVIAAGIGVLAVAGLAVLLGVRRHHRAAGSRWGR